MMSSKGNRLLTILLILLIVFNGQVYAWADHIDVEFSKEELSYIENRGIIKVAVADDAAPLHYRDSEGQVAGIAFSVLKHISYVTNLNFESTFYNSVDDLFNAPDDIVLGSTPKYSPDWMVLSEPYLTAETILFIRSGLDPNELDDKIYANVKGGSLPKGVKKENIREYLSRRATLEAIEKGEADYGYGNEYSVAFYNIQNGYKNIVTIPRGIEVRNYSIGFLKEDPILLSIINKSIGSIDDKLMERSILEMATNIERKISVQTIFANYGHVIFLIALLIVIVLSWAIYVNISYREQVIKKNKQLIEKSRIDGLTGIYNTNTTRDLIVESIQSIQPSSRDALIILDADNFKTINDNYGHLAGDKALQDIAGTLKSTFSQRDIIGRIGGDEFCIYMKGIPSSDFVYDILNQVQESIDQIGNQWRLSLSVGVKIVEGRADFKTLFHQADEAMYEAKSKGGKSIVIR